jgi:hypothetical protein
VRERFGQRNSAFISPHSAGSVGDVMKIGSATLALLCLCFAAPAKAQDWYVGPAPSEFAELRAAAVVNGEGHRLYVWPNHSEGRYRVMAELHLADGAEIAAMPRYRIDGAEEIDTDSIRAEGERNNAMWGSAGGSVAFWLLWTGAMPEVAADDGLRAWLTGREIEVTFKTIDGAEHRTVFPLAGAGPAILGAAGLTAP